ncbi:hypothetical protein BST61_g7270 [Cercospora zeina]
MHLSSIPTLLLLGASYFQIGSALSLHRRECLEPTPLETSTCIPDQWAWGNPWRIKIGVPHSDELCGKLDKIQRQSSKIDNFRCQKDGCGLTKVRFSMEHSAKNAKWVNEQLLGPVWPEIKFSCPTRLDKRETPALFKRECKKPTPTNDSICKTDGRGTADYWNIKLGVPHSDELCGKFDALQRPMPRLNFFRCQKDGCGLTKISFTLSHYEDTNKWVHESLAKVWPHVKVNCKPNGTMKRSMQRRTIRSVERISLQLVSLRSLSDDRQDLMSLSRVLVISALSLQRRECLEPTPQNQQTCSFDGHISSTKWHIKIGVPHSSESCGSLDVLQRTNSGIDKFHCEKDGCGLTKINFKMNRNEDNVKWINDNLAKVWPQVKFDCPASLRDVSRLAKRVCEAPQALGTQSCQITGDGHDDLDELYKRNPGQKYYHCEYEGNKYRYVIDLPKPQGECDTLQRLVSGAPDVQSVRCKFQIAGTTTIYIDMPFFKEDTNIKWVTQILWIMFKDGLKENGTAHTSCSRPIAKVF